MRAADGKGPHAGRLDDHHKQRASGHLHAHAHGLMVFGAYVWIRRGTPGRLLLALARQSPRRRMGIAAVAGTAVTVVSLVKAVLEGITGAWLLAAALPPGAVLGLGLWLVPPRMQRHMQGQDQESM